jgi:hypothetical protein
MIAEIPQGEHSTGQAGRTGQGKLKVKKNQHCYIDIYEPVSCNRFA